MYLFGLRGGSLPLASRLVSAGRSLKIIPGLAAGGAAALLAEGSGTSLFLLGGIL